PIIELDEEYLGSKDAGMITQRDELYRVFHACSHFIGKDAATAIAEFASPDAGIALTCGVPYRIDISCPPHDALDQLVQLGALDIEQVRDGLASIIPDAVRPNAVPGPLGVAGVALCPAFARRN